MGGGGFGVKPRKDGSLILTIYPGTLPEGGNPKEIANKVMPYYLENVLREGKTLDDYRQGPPEEKKDGSIRITYYPKD